MALLAQNQSYIYIIIELACFQVLIASLEDSGGVVAELSVLQDLW